MDDVPLVASPSWRVWSFEQDKTKRLVDEDGKGATVDRRLRRG